MNLYSIKLPKFSEIAAPSMPMRVLMFRSKKASKLRKHVWMKSRASLVSTLDGVLLWQISTVECADKLLRRDTFVHNWKYAVYMTQRNLRVTYYICDLSRIHKIIVFYKD